jgi:hypothetical protein
MDKIIFILFTVLQDKMKKILTSLLFCIIAVAGHAQIEMAKPAKWSTIGEVKSIGKTLAKLEYRIDSGDTLYFLLMKDFTKQQETNYFSVNFKGTGNTFSTLYGLLKSFFEDDNRKDKDYMKTFKLGETGVNLQHCTLIARHGVRLTTKEGYINLSEKDIDKLFGKR